MPVDVYDKIVTINEEGPSVGLEGFLNLQSQYLASKHCRKRHIILLMKVLEKLCILVLRRCWTTAPFMHLDY